MTKTISNLVHELIIAGASPGVAASAVAEAFALGASTLQSGGSQVDEAAERRRAWDRDRKREQRHLRLPVSEWYPLVEKILERDGHRCHYCGATEKLTADHVVPMTRGGTHDPENLVACCLPCNTKKGNKLLAEWLPKSADVHPTSGDTKTALNLSSLPTSEKHSEKKESKKVSTRKSPAIPLPPDWQPSESHFAAAEKLKISRQAVLEKAEDMRLWAASKDERRPGWDATFHGFLRRDAQKLQGNSYNGQAAKPNGLARTLHQLREHNRENERGDEGREPPPRLLSHG